ncbi:MAG: CoA transferase [Ilumatobacter sp.]|uniref:CoA transferase n=1 Tax=Ilumatobacter sp. TaxID=1967498 RepID=UPI003C75801B
MDLTIGESTFEHIGTVGPANVAASAFDVDGLLVDTARFAVGSIDGCGNQRGTPPPVRTIDREHLLAYCTTYVDLDGAEVPAWADLSGVYPTVGGRHLQVHCNFPHHAAGVVARLGCAADRASVASAIAERDAFELEAELIDDGMVGAAVRTLDEWDAHPHAVATHTLPLMSVDTIGDADPLPLDAAVHSADRPLAGLRVLDCSRVLAGPVAGQALAGFGADVLRVGADHLPSVEVGVISTGFGKRNTSLDLRTDAGRAAMAALIAEADVWIDAYRPGALASHGFTPERVAEIRPGIVVVQVCAFDQVGPWAGRRGFDSIVQSTTGIRWAGGEHGRHADGRPIGTPTGLPVQALDYATGFLAAGLAAQLVAHQRAAGGSWVGRTSLLRARDHLAARRAPATFTPASVTVDAKYLGSVESDFGRVTAVKPFAGTWPAPPERLGTSAPTWR